MSGRRRPPDGGRSPLHAAPRLDASFQDAFAAIAAQVERVLRGKRRAVHLSLVCLFAEGHLLIEDVPGVGKTSLAKAIARSIGGSWQRIQFTPDLLPSDVTGTSVWDRARGDFEFRPGGVFANVVLADEINRASPKTQSALLEAMEERQVTVDGRTHPLPSPFMVIATQNPIEMEGTYPLPEAQLDRFLLRLRIGYPDRDAELAILDAHGTTEVSAEHLEPVTDAATIASWSRELTRVHLAPELKGYVVDLVDATRRHRDLLLGVSTRGALALQRAARAFAASVGRAYVVPDDVKALAPAVLEHRLILSPEALMRGVSAADVLASVLEHVPVPDTRRR
ncbi:MAG: AAA family ATPase [Candidatus Rokubacteria bacterium]|nr:AAA family ATPase [Candidatus Rokubacteria bacterium]